MRYEDRLTKNLQQHQADLDQDREWRNKEKARRKEQRAFGSLPQYNPRMEFWCDKDQIDFIAPAYKVWIKTHQIGAWHSFCPICELPVYRHITSKKLDPYYAKSDKVKVMRGESQKDLLQPDQWGFRTLYGDPFEHYYRRFQMKSEALRDKYASMGLYGKSLREKSEEELLREEMEV